MRAVTEISGHIKIEGYYKIHNNLYDFDLNSGGLSKRNAAVGVGRASGVTSYILTGRMQYDYVMYFEGMAYVEFEWE